MLCLKMWLQLFIKNGYSKVTHKFYFSYYLCIPDLFLPTIDFKKHFLQISGSIFPKTVANSCIGESFLRICLTFAQALLIPGCLLFYIGSKSFLQKSGPKVPMYSLIVVNLLDPGWCSYSISVICEPKLSFWAPIGKLLSDEYGRTPLMTIQHWFS